MNQVRRGSAFVVALALSGCTIARPLIDRDMSKAPRAACAAVRAAEAIEAVKAALGEETVAA